MEHVILFRRRRGRLDVFVHKIEDFVSVIEIKSTDWDTIADGNQRKLLAAHRRQVLNYVDKYLEDEHVSVCAGIVYPKAPARADVRTKIEQYLNGHGLQVVWYDDKCDR